MARLARSPTGTEDRQGGGHVRRSTEPDDECGRGYRVLLGGTRPDRLYEVRPQGRVQRRTVEQNVDTALFLPSLDVPVPQMANQQLEVCRQIDTPIPKQVIDVPKISSSRQSHRRRVRFAEQTAEQLVEVPTIISYSSLRGIVEQNVDIPAPLRRGRSRGGLGFHPGQSSTAFSGADHRSLTFQLRVVAKIFLLQRRLPVCRVRQIMGFFALFPVGKKRALGLALGVRTAPRVEPIHAGGSAGGFLHGCSWGVDAFSQWQVETSGLGPRSLAAGVKAGTWPLSCVSLRLLLEEFLRVSCPLCSRSSHLESGTLFLRVLASGNPCSGCVGVVLCTKIGFFGR